MNARNSCYTYFKIVGDFYPDKISEMLELQPEESWKSGDLRPHGTNGTKYNFSLWSTGKCNEYDVEVYKQMRKTIAPLLGKTDVLNKIRLENDVSFYLEIVPTIYGDNINPCLAPSLDIIDFCHATRTEIDIDLYIGNSSDT